MARPWRIQFPDAIYHVTSRGNSREDIFLDDADKHLFLDTLATAISRFDLHLFAFYLMSNHFHFFLGFDGTEKIQGAAARGMEALSVK
jgi:REP element-mobilizing transposase RayT